MLVNQILSQILVDFRDFAIHQKKSVLILDKPIDVGFSILELTKLLMYKFHYEYVKNKLLNCCLLILIV